MNFSVQLVFGHLSGFNRARTMGVLANICPKTLPIVFRSTWAISIRYEYLHIITASPDHTITITQPLFVRMQRQQLLPAGTLKALYTTFFATKRTKTCSTIAARVVLRFNVIKKNQVFRIVYFWSFQSEFRKTS